MILAILHPFAFLGLLVGFLASVVLRAVVQHLIANRSPFARRERLFDPRRDIDVFGAVAAVIGGTGWGRKADDQARPAALIAGPLAVLGMSQLAFLGYVLLGGDRLLPQIHGVGDAFRGVPIGLVWEQFLYSFAIATLAFGLLALVPLPPLDGWGLLARRAGNRPSQGFARAHHWLVEQNIGVVILLVGMIIPLAAGVPLFVFLLDVVAIPFRVLWS